MTVTIRHGDCREVLKTMPDQSVHMCVTSPPYFGLRDYGTAKWDGGNADCDHMESREFVNPKNTVGPNGFLPSTNAANKMHAKQFRDVCGKCGAARIDSQIGLEPTPDAFVAEMVAVFAEVRRVLRDDGTLWLNLGDSYAATTKGSSGVGKNATNKGTLLADRSWQVPPGLKAKDLIGIPWRVAFALQADGWYLRQDIIWSKPNPMPESVTDRCTKAHEYIFLMSKSARYFYDNDAIREDIKDTNGVGLRAPKYDGGSGERMKAGPAAQERKTFTEIKGANRRSVWEIATSPYSEAHFATFPPDLIEPCIKAGCPIDGTVLDPFGGAGTTGLVADRLGRNAILIELNQDYAEMAERRIHNDAGLFAEIALDLHQESTE